MLGDLVKGLGDRALSGTNARLAQGGIGSWFANALEVLAAAGAGLCFAEGQRWPGLALFLVHGFFDYLDGALQRGGAPSGGSWRHAVTDKAAEVLVFGGLAIGGWGPLWLVLASLVTSVGATLVGAIAGAVRAVPRERSWFDRTDRMMLLLVGLLADLPVPFLAGILALNSLIVLSRALEAVRPR